MLRPIQRIVLILKQIIFKKPTMLKWFNSYFSLSSGRIGLGLLNKKFKAINSIGNISPLVEILLKFLELVLLVLLAYYFINHFVFVIIKIYNLLYNHYYEINIDIIGTWMVVNNEASTSTTVTTIINNNDGWASGIKSLYIYGAGALQLHLMRGSGTPLQKGFIIGGAIVADAASTALFKAINNPEYVEKHIDNWKRILESYRDSVKINVSDDSDTLSKLKSIKENFLPESLTDFKDDLLNKLLENLKPILEPVSVDYSNEILANQIYFIIVMLFILSIMIVLLIIGLLINMFIFVYTDKLKDLFTNKFIRAYISINKKIIGIEIFLVGSSILYFMYNLTYGLQFLATHRIVI